MYSSIIKPQSIPANPYEVHRILWKLFPNLDARPFIFRVEDNRILMRSTIKPLPSESIHVESKEIITVINRDDQFTFKLRANPRKRSDGKCRTMDRLEWIQKAFRDICSYECRITGDQTRTFRKDGMMGTYQETDYEGRLIVQDPRRLHDIIINGVGPQKAFGCGMLLLKRIS